MSELVVVGGLNMDLHVFELRGSSGQAPLIAERYLAQPGGKGGNVARAAARLGASVRLVARVGNDEFGRECVAAAARDGVDTSGVCSATDAPTGFVLIELVEGRHRSRVFAPGANDHLDWADVEPHLAHLSRGDMVIAQAEIPAAVLDALGNLVSERRLTLFLDPTPPNRVSAHHLACAEVITPDLAEAADLVGRRDTSMLWPSHAATELLAAGARRVIIKRGEAGALLAEPGGMVEIPTLSVDPVDETGAGDVFLAALAVARCEALEWEEATRLANVASALSVAEAGLVLPTLSEVKRRLAEVADLPRRHPPSTVG